MAPGLVPLLVAAMIVFSLAGCLSTKTTIHAGDAKRKGGAIRVAVFSDAGDVKNQKLAARETLVELFRLVDGKEVFLQRSLASRWGIDGLPPGSYRAKVVATLDAEGNIEDVRAGDRVTDMMIGEGDLAEVRIVMKKTPVGLVVVAAITVVILVIAMVILSRGNADFPSAPDLPGAVEGLPPPPTFDHIVLFADFADTVALLSTEGVDFPDDHETPPPRVTSMFPPPSSLVKVRRVSPAMTFSQEISTETLTPQTIRMLGSKSGLIPGRTEIDRGLLRFVSTRDLEPGESVTVTLRGEEVENYDGEAFGPDLSWSFRVAGSV